MCPLTLDVILHSLSTSVRSVGGAIAISIYTSIIQSQVSKNLAPEVAKAVIQAGLPPTMVERFVGTSHIFLIVS